MFFCVVSSMNGRQISLEKVTGQRSAKENRDHMWGVGTLLNHLTETEMLYKLSCAGDAEGTGDAEESENNPNSSLWTPV